MPVPVPVKTEWDNLNKAKQGCPSLPDDVEIIRNHRSVFQNLCPALPHRPIQRTAIHFSPTLPTSTHHTRSAAHQSTSLVHHVSEQA